MTERPTRESIEAGFDPELKTALRWADKFEKEGGSVYAGVLAAEVRVLHESIYLAQAELAASKERIEKLWAEVKKYRGTLAKCSADYKIIFKALDDAGGFEQSKQDAEESYLFIDALLAEQPNTLVAPCLKCNHPNHGSLCWEVKNEKGVATCSCSNY